MKPISYFFMRCGGTKIRQPRCNFDAIRHADEIRRIMQNIPPFNKKS